jgi:flagellar motor switch/type III secretory pathway protein FliN
VEQAVKARPYPWHALESVARDAPALLRDARRALGRALDAAKIAEALSEMVGERVRVDVAALAVSAADGPSLAGPKVVFATADDAVRLQIELESELARTLIARVLGRPIRPGDPRAVSGPEIDGAVLALVAQVARRAHGARDVLRPLGAGVLRLAPGERRLVLRATVMLGPDAYAAQVFLDLRRRAALAAELGPDDFAAFGELPVSLGVVVAASVADAAEVFALAPGDVWMPGRGWLVERTAGARALNGGPVGRVFLSPPSNERALVGTLGQNGEIVLVGVQSLPLDEEKSVTGQEHEHATATSEIVLDAPLVVRVEMGSVTMTMREWASLAAGDIIAMGRRVGEPVVLRAAGLEIARGELVDIEGELGVRIRERVQPA